MTKSIDPNDNNQQQRLTAEQVKQLMAMQQGAAPKKLTRKQAFIQKWIPIILQKMQNIQNRLNIFIDFVTKEHSVGRNDVAQAARSPMLFGIYVIIIFVGFGGIWSMLAPLNSAVVAVGTVLPSTNRKIIQHYEGGIIKSIFVKQGDHVKEGDKLVELEESSTKAKYEGNLHQYRMVLANESRLIAERDNQDSVSFPEFLLKDINIHEVERIIHTQENLFRSRRDIYRAEKESLKQKIAQSNKQIEGYESRKVAGAKNLEIVTDRLKAMKGLKEKGYVAKSAVLDLEAKEASLKSEIAISETEIARTKQEIIREEIESINYESKTLGQILQELREVQGQVAGLREQDVALQDAMKRIVIKSPVDGIINVIHVHTVGGVIGSGGQVLEISPTNDSLIIEAKVPHKNISSVHVGLNAKIRFSAFKSRTTPLFNGKVVSVSPDVVQDRQQMQQTEPYYIARIEIDMAEFEKIAKVRHLELNPGMQAEVQIVTGTRTLFKYLMDPVTDTMFRAFREK